MAKDDKPTIGSVLATRDYQGYPKGGRDAPLGTGVTYTKGTLADHERAHNGTPGAKVRHGADATGKVKVKGRTQGDAFFWDEDYKKD